MSVVLPIVAACEHRPVVRGGCIRCAECGAEYSFGLGGARWLEPRSLQRPRRAA